MKRILSLACTAMVLVAVSGTAWGVEDASWGRIKAMYRGGRQDVSITTAPEEPLSSVARYPLRDSPQNVLAKLEQAYEGMDAPAYLDCLAEDFIFFLNPDDLTEHPELPEYWDKAEEVQIHENMFGEGTNVEGVTLVFTLLTAVWDDSGTADPLDDLWTYIEATDLRVQLPPDLTLHAAAPAEFLFRVDPDETGPTGEILWEIWKQWDLASEDPVEASTWTRIKSLFSG